jgi:hypothetical protein
MQARNTMSMHGTSACRSNKQAGQQHSRLRPPAAAAQPRRSTLTVACLLYACVCAVLVPTCEVCADVRIVKDQPTTPVKLQLHQACSSTNRQQQIMPLLPAQLCHVICC